MGNRKYDFAGWVTKNDIRCSDGVTIKHDAFKDNDGQQVPLVWNHKYTSPGNVLGHVMLQNRDQGVYGYGYFNDSEDAKQAKELVKHGDISSMSIGARKIKRNGTDIVHGSIYEVSLVLAAANPGAMIETVMQHSDSGEEEKSIIHTGTLIHSADDVIEDEDQNIEHKAQGGETQVAGENTEKTIGDIIDAMTEEQQEAVYALLGMVTEAQDEQDDEVDNEAGSEDNTKHSQDTENSDDNIKHNNDKGDGEVMKHNVFAGQGNESAANATVLKHGINEVLKQAYTSKASSLKDLIAEAISDGSIKHGETLTHGINSIEMLFPDAFKSTNGNQPILYNDPNTAFAKILDGVTKSPFAKVKTLVADLTEDEARAKGYIKGNLKKEEFFSLIKRATSPTTVYKKQKLDRDDILDITDFDVVAFMNVEMQMKLKEEVARAILVGDGRDFSAEDKIDEQHIRPIITDNEFFTIHKSVAADGSDFIEKVITAMGEYRGSGMPDLYIDLTLLATIKLLKDSQGRFLFGDIPSNAAIAARLGVNSIVPTTFMSGKGAVIVNLRDYTLGAVKGGEVTNFDQFDIDFNQHKYLSETRLSGALTMPKSAISFAPTTALVGATDAAAGVTKGERQADKLV
jgi:HK97 family phage prohead protease